MLLKATPGTVFIATGTYKKYGKGGGIKNSGWKIPNISDTYLVFILSNIS